MLKAVTGKDNKVCVNKYICILHACMTHLLTKVIIINCFWRRTRSWDIELQSQWDALAPLSPSFVWRHIHVPSVIKCSYTLHELASVFSLNKIKHVTAWFRFLFQWVFSQSPSHFLPTSFSSLTLFLHGLPAASNGLQREDKCLN